MGGEILWPTLCVFPADLDQTRHLQGVRAVDRMKRKIAREAVNLILKVHHEQMTVGCELRHQSSDAVRGLCLLSGDHRRRHRVEVHEGCEQKKKKYDIVQQALRLLISECSRDGHEKNWIERQVALDVATLPVDGDADHGDRRQYE